MIVQNPKVKGGIAAVANGYRGSKLEEYHDITYVESYCDGSKARKLIKAVSGCFSYLFVLITKRPRLTHMHTSFGPSFYRSIPFIVMSKLFKVPVINHIHGSEFDRLYTDAPGWKKKLIRFMWGLCDRIIVLTPEWKDRLSEAAAPSKVRVVGNYGPPVTERDGDMPFKQRILFLGLFTELKGVLDAVEVMKKVHEKFPKAVLYMAGDGPLSAEVDHRIRETELEKTVRLTGWVRGKRKERLLKGCDIFYLPSYTEALPMSILEAFAYGLAVVSCNVGGIPALVTDNENGLLCEPGDTDAQAEALMKLLEDEALRTRLTRRATQRLADEFSLERHIADMTSVYSELL